MKKRTPDYWPEAIKHLSENDATLGAIIANYPGEILSARGDAFYTLTRSIIGQQISVKAADAVWNKVEQGVGGMLPGNVQQASEDTLRACGLSRQKVTYTHALADFFLQRKHAERDWESMDDEAVIADLTTIKGIGRWTAEMFLMFHLLRPDVFPVADLGLQKAINKHYDAGMPPKHMPKLAESWRPYRSVAVWYLWRSLDPVPVEY